MSIRPWQGVFPVVPTIFAKDGALDLPGQLRCIDFMIDAGSDGLCILANFSEQFSLGDDERAAMVMVMPPYHGATFRVAPAQIRDFFETVADGLPIPIMIQDAPASGTNLPAPFLVELARDIAAIAYFKIEVPQAASKLIALGGAAIEGPWDGEEAITLLADLDAGATGAMTGGAYPDLIGPIVRAHLGGDRATAVTGYNRVLPLINYENRQGGILSAKVLMKEGGIIACDHGRAPLAPLPAPIRAGLIETARALEPLVLRWA